MGEDGGQAGVTAQEVEEPWSHAMGIHNSTAWLSGKAMDAPLSHPLCFDPFHGLKQHLSARTLEFYEKDRDLWRGQVLDFTRSSDHAENRRRLLVIPI